MEEKIYTLLDLAERFGKDKQFIRRRIMKLKHIALNKETREHINEPLEYDHHTYLELAKELGKSDIENNDINEIRYDTQSNTHETHDDMQKNTDKVIEVLERELKHSKDKFKKSEEEKETLMRLLDQQQRLSLQANQKIEMLEHKEKEVEETVGKIKDDEKKKWWQIFKKYK